MKKYKLHITVDGYEDFEFALIAIDEDNMLQIHEAILDAVNFKADQLASFSICDHSWIKEIELTLIKMGDEELIDDGISLMKDHTLGEFTQNLPLQVVYEYDFASQWKFYLIANEYTGDLLEATPYMSDIHGKAPNEDDGIERSMIALGEDDLMLLAGTMYEVGAEGSEKSEYDEDGDEDDDDDEFDENRVGNEDDMW